MFGIALMVWLLVDMMSMRIVFHFTVVFRFRRLKPKKKLTDPRMVVDMTSVRMRSGTVPFGHYFRLRE